ncbi:MAG: bifunctional oligoribonuclease/PAP phosphatase NrnA [bacterium]|nr:bifunctional oligoribonuclease/PAP phosphatase NrnA [bacterium]
MDSPETILKTIKAGKRILIPMHLRPDGDMIGSALALNQFLKSLGKSVTITSVDPLPNDLAFPPGSKQVERRDPANMDLGKFDILLLADNGDSRRYSRSQDLNLPSQLLVINIDHHDSNYGFGDLNYVNQKAASTGEIIYELFKKWRVKITPTIADCLLLAIYTDTGGFLNPKTSADSLAAAADLVKKGGNREKIVDKAFWGWSPKAQAAWAVILKNVRMRKGISYSQISKEELKKSGCTLTELSAAKGFAANSLMLSAERAKAAVIFVEEAPRKVRVNLRSKGKFNVGRIAKSFGGGGHFNSAAFDYDGPLKEAVAKTIRVMAR